MNDETENVWVHSVLKSLFASAERRTYSVEVHDVLYEVECKYASNQVAPRLLIACFSSVGDLLSQWRAYAKDGTGYSIGFSTQRWQFPTAVSLDSLFTGTGLSSSLERVVYGENEQVAALRRALDQLDDLITLPEIGPYMRDALRDTGIDLLFYVARFLKHPAFFEEREWRIACAGSAMGLAPESVDRGISGEVKYRADAFPYRDFDFRAIGGSRAITEIILGPKCVASVDDVRALARSSGFDEAIVRRSTIPYR
jgi:hypothetical protein